MTTLAILAVVLFLIILFGTGRRPKPTELKSADAAYGRRVSGGDNGEIIAYEMPASPVKAAAVDPGLPVLTYQASHEQQEAERDAVLHDLNLTIRRELTSRDIIDDVRDYLNGDRE